MSNKTVVIADDTSFVRDRFSTALAETGVRTVAVATVADLLACLRPAQPKVDLIVLDLQLPPARGVSLVRAVRERAAEVSIVVFSGTIADASDVRALASLGVAGYVNEYSAPQHILPSLAPHLFPDQFDRRTSPRVTVSITVSYRVGTLIASALSLNLSKGGLAVRTMTPLDVHTNVKVRFRCPGDSRDLEADAHVCWADRSIGMGLQFDRMSATDQAALDDYIDGHFFNNRRA